MTIRRLVVIGILWLGGIVWAAGVGRAQIRPQQITPFVVTGADIGFQIEGRRGNTPVGHLVIRKDANSPWTPVELGSSANSRPID